MEVCSSKKEIKLKYELENNVNLVSFENMRIEISFNDELDKEFIKNLTSKLNEWTSDRWLITLSQKKGGPTIKEKNINFKNELIQNAKKDKVFAHKALESAPASKKLLKCDKRVFYHV